MRLVFLSTWQRSIKSRQNALPAEMRVFIRSNEMDVYEVRSRKDKRGVYLISDVLPFGRCRCIPPGGTSPKGRRFFLQTGRLTESQRGPACTSLSLLFRSVMALQGLMLAAASIRILPAS